MYAKGTVNGDVLERYTKEYECRITRNVEWSQKAFAANTLKLP